MHVTDSFPVVHQLIAGHDFFRIIFLFKFIKGKSLLYCFLNGLIGKAFRQGISGLDELHLLCIFFLGIQLGLFHDFNRSSCLHQSAENIEPTAF